MPLAVSQPVNFDIDFGVGGIGNVSVPRQLPNAVINALASTVHGCGCE
jgi:hypothetical protein